GQKSLARKIPKPDRAIVVADRYEAAIVRERYRVRFRRGGSQFVDLLLRGEIPEHQPVGDGAQIKPTTGHRQNPSVWRKGERCRFKAVRQNTERDEALRVPEPDHAVVAADCENVTS